MLINKLLELMGDELIELFLSLRKKVKKVFKVT